MSEVTKLRALLAEARRELGCIEALTVHPGVHNGPGGDALCQFLARIDAALAEPMTAEYSQDEVNAMTTDMIAVRKAAERAAFQSGAEAMREAAALLVSNERRLWLRSELVFDIRALPIPEDRR